MTQPGKLFSANSLCGLLTVMVFSYCHNLHSRMPYTEDAACVIRCMPSEDATNGFFVSCFIKRTGRAERTNTSMATKTNKAVIRQQKTVSASMHTTISSSDIQNQNGIRMGNKRKAERSDHEELEGHVEGEGGGGDGDGEEGASQQKKKKRKGKRKKSAHNADNAAS